MASSWEMARFSARSGWSWVWPVIQEVADQPEFGALCVPARGRLVCLVDARRPPERNYRQPIRLQQCPWAPLVLEPLPPRLGPSACQIRLSGEQSANFGFIAELSSDLARSIAE